MTDDTIQHLYKFREELQRARELIQEELRYLRDKSVKHGVSITHLEKELEETKREIDQVKRLVDKLIDQKELLQNHKNSKESVLTCIIKNPVIIIGIIAIALIVMVIELQNKDTGGIVKPIMENYGNNRSK